MRRFLLLFLLTTAAIAQEIPSPAPAGAAQPHLTTTPRGSLIMSWTEPGSAAGQHAVRFAVLQSGKWSTPQTIIERADLFVNWADFPAIAMDRNGALFAHWLQKSGKGTYAYHVFTTASTDGGKSWTKPRRLHADSSDTEHGFVSLSPLAKGGVAAVWLDGRNMQEEGKGSMQLRYAELDASGKIGKESLLDPRVCECCTTGMAIGARGPVIAYRDRSEAEVRDISYVRRGSGWSSPALVRKDGWTINGCPVNGPQVDARGNHVVAAWYTGADSKGQVYVAFSSDGGATFRRAIRADGGAPVGRVDVAWTGADVATVVWIEGVGEAAQIVARTVTSKNSLGPITRIGSSSAARAAGFPRMAVAGGETYVAWTEPSTPKRIRVAKIKP